MNKTIPMTLTYLFAALSGGCSADGGDLSFEQHDLEQSAQLEQALHQDNGNHFGNQPFLLASPNFEDGAALPAPYTCEGNPFATGVTPELEWTKGPKGTKSYAIVFADTTLVDAGQPNFGYHWAVWNIPHDRHTLPEGIMGLDPADPTTPVLLPKSLKGASHAQARGLQRFFGPCPAWQVTLAERCGLPPVARNTDAYSFTIYALADHDIDVPAHDPGVNTNYVDRLNQLFDSIALGKTVLTTTSDAVPSTVPFACP